MERMGPRKSRIKEVDTSEDYCPDDKARYYEGQHFELGGVEFGQENVRIEEQERKFSRFSERIRNENDYVGIGPRDYKRLDEDIFHEVCEALTDNPQLDATNIEVEVNDGLVNLKGQVSSRMDKREAQKCVEFLSGVRDIINELRFFDG